MDKQSNSYRWFASGKQTNPQPPERNDTGDRDETRGRWVFGLLFAVCLAGGLAAGAGLTLLVRMYETLPTLDQFETIHQPLVSRVLASDSTVIHEFSTERRFWVSLDEVPADLVNAVIAIEDRRFFTHWGIDLRRIASALVVDIIKGEYAQGASTLTQQLARNIYLTSRRSLVRKLREALTAVQIERHYSKKEIMELYLNQVYLGAGVYGVEAAARRYFSKSVSELNLNECAVLAGTIQVPEHYRPDREENHKRTRMRRNSVIRGMRTMGFIDRPTARRVSNDSIPSNPQVHTAGSAPYFIEMVRRVVASKYGDDLLYTGGLTIHTTLDPVAQDSAETAAKSHLRSLQKRLNRMFLDSANAPRLIGVPRKTFLNNFDSLYQLHKEQFSTLPDSVRRRRAQCAVVAMDVETGALRALIGGRNFKESKFNRATQSRRQPGSAIKPVVYAAAMENGFTPASVVLDQPITLETPEGDWRPENYGGEFRGPVTVRTALAKSINLVAIQVLNSIGAETVIAYARKLGLKQRMVPVPALAIGACEVIPIEMAAAYAVFPSLGTLTEPYCVERILDKNGKLLFEHTPERRAVLAPQTAYLMCSLMSDVVRRGTGASIPGKGFVRPAAGKTGTTNSYSDAWFVGYTPQISCAVWVGVDERRSMGHGVTGARGAIPIWVPTMKALHRDLPIRQFSRPSGIVTAGVCGETHKIAGRYCPGVYEEIFAEGSLPDSCDVHFPGRRPGGSRGGDVFGSKRGRDRGKRRDDSPLMF